MRTLKKVLAMTVVLATLLSISAFAGFSDEDKIDDNFVDAVNLLGALNVMTGDTEGTFRPNDTISRAEAAKMIYVIRNGGVDDKAAGWTGMTTFSDVASGVWYEGYVNYCASLGIIAGIGGGKFNPSGAVTGVELAKMMLVVADYRPDIEQYTGTGWNLNVIRDAQAAGMFKGYTLAYSAAATRQQAAQLFANAILETEMAIYIGDVRLNSAAGLGNAETIGERFFELNVVTGVLTKVPHVVLPLDVTGNNTQDVVLDGSTSTLNVNDSLSAITAFNNEEHVTTSFDFDADPDLLYQEVTVIYQEANEGGILDRKDKVYAVLSTDNSYVYETTMDGITIELDDDSKDLNNAQGQNYNPAVIKFEGYNSGRAKALVNTLPVVTNLYEGAQVNPANMGTHKASWDKDVYLIDEADVRMLATTSTAPVRLIDIDGNGELDVAFVTTLYYGTVSSYNPDRYEFTTSATIGDDNITTNRRQENFENFTFADDLEKEDVIAVNIDVLSGEMLYNVSLVEASTGEVTYVYSTDPDNEVVIGGETYGFYGLKFDGKYLTQLNPVLEADRYHEELGKEVSVYTDGKYIISAEVKPASIGTGFAFIKNYNPEGNSFNPMPDDSQALLLELVLASGETVVKEYDVDEVNSTTSNYFTEAEVRTMLANGKLVGNIVEYSSKGNYVAFRNNHKTTAGTDPLYANYHNTTAGTTYTFDSATGLFRVTGRNQAFDVNEDSVFFLPTFKDNADPANLGRNDITKVSVIKGSDLRGTPTITTVEDTTTANDVIMRLISCMQSGVRTAAYGVLDADSTVSDTGIFAYALTNDWDKDDGEEDARQVRAVVSDSGSDEGAIINLDNSDILANKVYRATRNSDGTYTLDQIINGETVDGATMRLGSIDGRRGNNVTIDGNVYSVTEETVIFVVDIDARGSMTRINLGDVADLTEAAEDKNENPYNNVLFESANNELSVVYVEAVGMDVTQLINYRAVNTVTAETPALAAGMDQLQAETAVKAAMPKTADVSLGNWTPATFPMVAGTNYSVDVTLTPKAGTTFEVDGNGNFTVKVGNSSYSGALNADGSFTFTLNNLAATNGKITSADVTEQLSVAALTAGDNPNTSKNTLTAGKINNVVNGDALTAQANFVTWYDMNGTQLAGTVTAGQTYELRFTLVAAQYYAFAQDFSLTVGNATDVQLTFNQDYTQVTVSALVTVANPISLTGSALATTLTHNTTSLDTTAGNVTIGGSYNTLIETKSVVWQGDANSDGKATFGETLSVDVTLGVKTGQTFSFANMKAADFTVPTGYKVESVTLNGRGDTSVTLHISAPAVAKAEIDAVTLAGLTAPVKDQPLVGQDAVTSSTTGVTVTGLTWETDAGVPANAGDNAAATTVYKATVTLTVETGYAFDTTDLDPTSDVSGTNGESTAAGSTFNSDTLVVVITYAATGA